MSYDEHTMIVESATVVEHTLPVLSPVGCIDFGDHRSLLQCLFNQVALSRRNIDNLGNFEFIAFWCLALKAISIFAPVLIVFF